MKALRKIAESTIFAYSRSERKDIFQFVFARYGSYVVLILLVIVSGILQPIFFHPRNIFNLLLRASPLGIVAVGQLIVVLGGGIDLSVASLMATTNIIAAAGMLGRNELCLPVSLICLGVGALVGLTNGVLITKRGIPPFIMTLGMMILLQGIRFVWTRGAPRGTIPSLLRFIGTGRIWIIPTAVLVFGLVAGVGAIILYYTTYGRQLYATGGNRQAAKLSGINVDKVIIISYVICGFLAALAGLVLTGYLGLADNWAGKGYELESIAAVVVGGAYLMGGRGTIEGTIAGVLIMSILVNMVLLLNLDVELGMIVQGIVLIGAVAFYKVKKLG
ncbi:ABC transporter permease [Candidatus Aerophobetes bacterium]|nr:ABC transporter permease [Candidatus Aerophobetes bacterium]